MNLLIVIMFEKLVTISLSVQLREEFINEFQFIKKNKIL
jgi:hypothetical protein